MENAVKALLIAAGVLIGVMTISLGVALYSSLGVYVESMHEDIRDKELQQFNNQYTKYIDIELTIHDVVTAANTAYESNNKYNLTESEDNNYYVTINLFPGNVNLEKNISSHSSEILENGLGKKYKCSYDDVKFNTETGRVYQVNFHVDN